MPAIDAQARTIARGLAAAIHYSGAEPWAAQAFYEGMAAGVELARSEPGWAHSFGDAYRGCVVHQVRSAEHGSIAGWARNLITERSM